MHVMFCVWSLYMAGPGPIPSKGSLEKKYNLDTKLLALLIHGQKKHTDDNMPTVSLTRRGHFRNVTHSGSIDGHVNFCSAGDDLDVKNLVITGWSFQGPYIVQYIY